jgi:segregation and condensation protein A
MDGHTPEPTASLMEEGEGGTPRLALDGFSGPLDLLLNLARTHEVDLARISLRDLVEQLAAALAQAAPLSRKADWVTMAAWLTLLRTHLLLPAEAARQRAAAAETDQLREQLGGLQVIQALAAWLEHRPQLGRDVFGRGRPEPLGASTDARHEVDVIEFLWASLALFDEPENGGEAATAYRPRPRDLYPAAETRERILRLLAEMPDGAWLGRLLPRMPAGAETTPEIALRRRSAWASTLIASLELARQGEVALAQGEAFQPIQARLVDHQRLPGAA